MKSTIKKLPKSKVELDISLTAKELAEFFQKALDKLREKVKVEGFRQGKAPDVLVMERLGRATVEAEALDFAINHSFHQAIHEHNILPINSPNINVKKYQLSNSDQISKDEVNLEYGAEVDIIPEVEVKDYKDIKIKKTSSIQKISKTEIFAVIEHLRKSRARLNPIDQPLKKDDWAEINFTGSIDHVARDELKSDHFPLIIGETNLIPGFAENLIGLKKDEEKTFSLTFPKDYHKKDLQNKKAEFQVKVLQTQERILPEINEQFLKDHGLKTKDELEKAIEKSLLTEKETQADNEWEQKIIEEVLKRTKAEIPESLIEQETERLLNEMKDRITNIKMDWSSYIAEMKKTETEIKKELQNQAEKNVKIGLSFGKIMKEENIGGEGAEAMRKVMEKLKEYASK